MKRQEVGRGLRLCVNQDGFRMDEMSLGRDLVHKVNKLTVVASESYKDFVTDLQKQIREVLYDRPTKASKEYFVGKTVQVDGVPQKISEQQATAIYRYLLKNDYIDDDEHITEQYHADLTNNALAPLADEMKPMTEGIHKLIQSIFDDKVLEEMIGNGNETTVPSNDLNENFAKKNFRHFGITLTISMHIPLSLTVMNLLRSPLNRLIGNYLYRSCSTPYLCQSNVIL